MSRTTCPAIMFDAERDGCIPDLGKLGKFERLDYSAADKELWRELISRRRAFNLNHGSAAVVRGYRALGITPDRFPDHAEIDRILYAHTGWRILEVEMPIGEAEIHKLTAARIRPLHYRIRCDLENKFDWPDLVHDYFHLLPLFNPDYAEFCRRLTAFYGEVVKRERTDLRIIYKRISWHLVEYGLAKEGNLAKANGPILNENAEGEDLLREPHRIREMTLADVAELPFPWEENHQHRIGLLMPAYALISDFARLLSDFTAWSERIRNSSPDDHKFNYTIRAESTNY